MRVPFCQRMVEAAQRPELVFLTGDLGFKALEPLRDALGERFLNAGVAEQNMVSLAAGLARSGLRPVAYSIAPFIYARPFEQVRNDVCLHRLPVTLVGNGGGYGYGVMGATHHAIEDYGTMLALSHMRVLVPAFDGDLGPMIAGLAHADGPVYLRLGVSEQPDGMPLPPYSPWRKLVAGDGGGGATVLVIGPLVGGIADAARRVDAAARPDVWVLSELPFDAMPAAFLADVARTGHLVVVEEHVEQGSVGTIIASRLLAAGAGPRRFAHLTARGYPSGRYGSQKWHRRESGLDPASVMAAAGAALAAGSGGHG